MDYSLLSGTGNLIDSVTDEPEARVALQRIVSAEPEAVVEGPIHAVRAPRVVDGR